MSWARSCRNKLSETEKANYSDEQSWFNIWRWSRFSAHHQWIRLKSCQFKHWFRFWTKKLNFFAKVTIKEKIVILCKIITDDLIDVDSKLFSFKFFVKLEHLIFLDQFLSVRFFIDIDASDYVFVHFNLIDQICDHLNLEPILFSKSKRLRDYDDAISFTVTHVIYFNIRIKKHKQFIVSMFIADFEDHEIILSKSWMNQCDLLLNMKNDSLIFFQAISSIKIESSNDAIVFKSTIVDLNVLKSSKKIRILPRRRSNSNEQSFFIYSVSAKSFDLLVRQQEV